VYFERFESFESFESIYGPVGILRAEIGADDDIIAWFAPQIFRPHDDRGRVEALVGSPAATPHRPRRRVEQRSKLLPSG
jgi:hypothetical protein